MMKRTTIEPAFLSLYLIYSKQAVNPILSPLFDWNSHRATRLGSPPAGTSFTSTYNKKESVKEQKKRISLSP